MSGTPAQDNCRAGQQGFAATTANPLDECVRQEGIRQLNAVNRDVFPDSDSLNTAVLLLMRVREAGRIDLPQAN